VNQVGPNNTVGASNNQKNPTFSQGYHDAAGSVGGLDGAAS
jgi:hypothetical protein